MIYLTIPPEGITRDEIIELAASSDLEGMAAEIFARLGIDEDDVLEAFCDA